MRRWQLRVWCYTGNKMSAGCFLWSAVHLFITGSEHTTIVSWGSGTRFKQLVLSGLNADVETCSEAGRSGSSRPGGINTDRNLPLRIVDNNTAPHSCHPWVSGMIAGDARRSVPPFDNMMSRPVKGRPTGRSTTSSSTCPTNAEEIFFGYPGSGKGTGLGRRYRVRSRG